jgi:hypothetical protein
MVRKMNSARLDSRGDYAAFNPKDGGSKRSQKGDQGCFVCGAEVQAKLVAGDGAALHSEAAESGGLVVGVQASGIKPVFEGCNRTVMFERGAIPDAL